ncbi:GNAT family N-acetyltransferase [Leucobacter sp. NPDC058333]|uniref:GNAT family N-acetyltransferase n=1 Tax=Leucobacter sp. NPDC058333 TaxID=3346450 RepID=UPI00365EFF38
MTTPTQRRSPEHAEPKRLVRTATLADLDQMTIALTEAFFDDPVWGPTFPDRDRRREQASAYWRFAATEALRFPESVVAVDPEGAVTALAVWLPPGADEISASSIPAYDALVADILDPEAAVSLHAAGHAFETARPSEPHAYLTLLAVAPEFGGRGEGMRLLREVLRRYDAAGTPTYLESSNPVNDVKYESLGYQPHGRVRLAGGAEVQTYWRDPEPLSE